MRAIESCRTAALGGHVRRCGSCGHEENAYNSCRNRHCNKCQSIPKARWIEARKAEVLPVGYFHLVFTLPHALNPLILTNKRELLSALFRAVSQTLLAFGERHLGGQIGGTLILHTWDQKLGNHFHIHCVVPAGALVDSDRWRHARAKFLFPVRALSDVFRGKYLAELKSARKAGKLQYLGRSKNLGRNSGFALLLRTLREKRWVVYSKAPFGGPNHLIEYLGRYTHRVALSNERILSADHEQVTIAYRDRKHGDRPASMRFAPHEFIRRFLLHTLPPGFQRIRHFGFLANRAKRKALQNCRTLLHAPAIAPIPKRDTAEMVLELTGIDIGACPKCASRALSRVRISPEPPIHPRGPP